MSTFRFQLRPLKNLGSFEFGMKSQLIMTPKAKAEEKKAEEPAEWSYKSFCFWLQWYGQYISDNLIYLCVQEWSGAVGAYIFVVHILDFDGNQVGLVGGSNEAGPLGFATEEGVCDVHDTFYQMVVAGSNLWICDMTNNTVQQFTTAGAWVKQLAVSTTGRSLLTVLQMHDNQILCLWGAGGESGNYAFSVFDFDGEIIFPEQEITDLNETNYLPVQWWSSFAVVGDYLFIGVLTTEEGNPSRMLKINIPSAAIEGVYNIWGGNYAAYNNLLYVANGDLVGESIDYSKVHIVNFDGSTLGTLDNTGYADVPINGGMVFADFPGTILVVSDIPPTPGCAEDGATRIQIFKGIYGTPAPS
jgi:hypothetical protein